MAAFFKQFLVHISRVIRIISDEIISNFADLNSAWTGTLYDDKYHVIVKNIIPEPELPRKCDICLVTSRHKY